MAASLPIPIYSSLEEVYCTLGTSLKHAYVEPESAEAFRTVLNFTGRERWDNLARRFNARFGELPAYIVRAPGRVK